ncbi:MAG: endolytic transglycosylase MltG [Ruminococcaceae bacterium]|nr:endolytic transglycosylase MltG [Oscillospiraceae bacterium]
MINSERTRKDEWRLRRASSIILPLFFLSVLISALIVSVANDMYAFVKPQREITLEISESMELSEISDILADNGIISNPTVFSIYVLSKDAEERISEFSGTLSLNSSMSYREILRSFKKNE